MSRGNRLQRRTALKGIGAGVVGLSGLSSGAIAGGGRTTKIVTAIGKTDKEVKEVSAKWWDYEQKADQAEAELRDQLRDNPNIQSIVLTNSDTIIDGRYASAIRVHPRPSFTGSLPDQVDGVPVIKGEYHGEPGFASDRGCYFNDDYSYVGGGMIIDGTEYYGSAGSLCTKNGGTY